MILEWVAITVLLLLISYFVFGAKIEGVMSFIVLVAIFGSFFVFAGVCLKFGWNLL